MNILAFGLATALILGCLYASPAQAQLVSGVATTYNVTINQVELCKSAACTSPIVVGSGAKAFDIASAAIGASIGSYASLDSIPKGTTITHIRATMPRAIGIAGSTADPGNVGGTCGTDVADATSAIAVAGVGIIGGGGTTQNLVVPNELAFAGEPAAGTYAAEGIVLTSATEMTFTFALTSPFTMGDSPPVIDISFKTATSLQSFDSNGAVAGGTCSMLPGPPLVSVTVRQ